jgi:hypothetical protein
MNCNKIPFSCPMARVFKEVSINFQGICLVPVLSLTVIIISFDGKHFSSNQAFCKEVFEDLPLLNEELYYLQLDCKNVRIEILFDSERQLLRTLNAM